jgi:hypothetical protein
MYICGISVIFISYSQPKGKQGTKGQKQIETENKQTLSFYMYIVLCVNVSIKIFDISEKVRK